MNIEKNNIDSYKRIRRDYFSVYIFNCLLKRRSHFLPRAKDAAKSATEYADALIEELDKNFQTNLDKKIKVVSKKIKMVKINDKYCQ
jgi:hypothetical protein